MKTDCWLIEKKDLGVVYEAACEVESLPKAR